MAQPLEPSWSLAHPVEGPLVARIKTFTSRMMEQGYAASSVHVDTRLIADFSRWLKEVDVALPQITPGHVDQYLKYRVHHRRPREGDLLALTRLLTLLREEGDIAPVESLPIEASPADQLVEKFAGYLRKERSLVPNTIRAYVPVARRFLAERFGSGVANLRELSASDVVAFVRRVAASHHPRYAKTMTSALRSFLQFARYRGDLTSDLAAAIPAVANWSQTSIPRAIAPDHARAILAHCDIQTAVGRRDHAILLLLARLGLRACEICELKLEDMDWEAGQLRVRGKGGRECQLPLPAEVGDSIASYLQHGRPSSTDRHLFLRARAPIRELQPPQAIGAIVTAAFERAGIESSRKGAHQFRHALATQMLNHGASLAEIGKVLRHRTLQTTTIYAKVDLTALRALALPWPGAAS
ncbi:hypothetical protein APR50_10705 [Variovorax paradoxus]|uniref:site-specific integrase n=1 Tax=Comamonadaceae TaxID=80864 RepID=UPI0006E59539|nr:site-specific integrase [Xenophilus azovorans]KPU94329.1 hypothetical protein APR49_38340 [Variovorax paradoxus]VTY38168.1 Tyrosine recombinase XerD [Xylophilus ampelinus]KPU99386.1 hypothetical protein APR52_02865 [Variovorax paradoxus]KPV08664.1 hypothetical protein APR50_10705 [Variovorax paradoxus]KPV15293.1 hypothetical protein APR51_35050 [Variovorax paradoxus]|tara:strand:+ start:193 stop:1431 length:1239 start_codon:yes stop_codon:yes gene_type:complete